MNPAIVVVAYNRDYPLKRILNSISKAHFDSSVDFIISIDKNDNDNVYDLANSFTWVYGKKEVLRKERHLGLKQHILECGDLTDRYGSIILLEDDLFVSRYFYKFAKQCLKFYEHDSTIAGVSLYSQRFNETSQMAFHPIDNNSDVFFLQIASSWGQCWTKEQWRGFRKWYEENGDRPVTEPHNVPLNVVQWPETSWKKYFIRYMIEYNKYFVYPRVSLSSNFHDLGTHHEKKDNYLQVPLQLVDKPWHFNTVKDSIAVYDAYHEILPEKLKNISKDLEDFDFEVDFYGQKNLEFIDKEYILTSRVSEQPLTTYGKELKPIELNVVYDIEGTEISLTRKDNCSRYPVDVETHSVAYYFNIPTYFLVNEEQIRCKEEFINRFYYSYFNDKIRSKEQLIQYMTSSISWKLTSPLRWIYIFLRKLKHKIRSMRHQLEVQSRVGSQSSGTSEKAFIRKGIGDYAAQEKIAILKRHLLEKLPVSVVCDQYGLDTETFYSWQEELFQNGAIVFDKQKD